MIRILRVLVITTVLYSGATMAQSGCNNALASLSLCLDYLTGGSSSPSSDCCSHFSTIIKSSPECLCSVVNNHESSFLGFKFNRTVALNLPFACNIQTPSPNQCNAVSNGSAIFPPSSPIDSPQTAISPAGSKTIPLSNESSSNKNVIVVSLVSSIVMVFLKI